MSWVSVGVTAANLAYKAGIAIHQKRQADKMEEGLVDPTFEIPSAATEALNIAKQQASQRGFAGQEYAENRLEQRTANTTADILRGGTNSGDVLASLTQVDANNRGAENEMAYFAAQDYNSRINNLGQANNQYAAWQGEKQQKDVYDKFNRTAAAISALRFGSINNGGNAGNYAANAANYLIPMIQNRNTTNQYSGAPIMAGDLPNYG